MHLLNAFTLCKTLITCIQLKSWKTFIFVWIENIHFLETGDCSENVYTVYLFMKHHYYYQYQGDILEIREFLLSFHTVSHQIFNQTLMTIVCKGWNHKHIFYYTLLRMPSNKAWFSLWWKRALRLLFFKSLQKYWQ